MPDLDSQAGSCWQSRLHQARLCIPNPRPASGRGGEGGGGGGVYNERSRRPASLSQSQFRTRTHPHQHTIRALAPNHPTNHLFAMLGHSLTSTWANAFAGRARVCGNSLRCHQFADHSPTVIRRLGYSRVPHRWGHLRHVRPLDVSFFCGRYARAEG